MIGSWSILEEKFQECNMREGVGLATSVETLGVDLSTRTKHLRANEKAGRQKCDVRFSFSRRNRVLQQSHTRSFSGSC